MTFLVKREHETPPSAEVLNLAWHRIPVLEGELRKLSAENHALKNEVAELRTIMARRTKHKPSVAIQAVVS